MNDAFIYNNASLETFSGICIFAEHRFGKLHEIVPELIGCAKDIAKNLKYEISAILLSEETSQLANELLSYGVDKVFTVTSPHLSDFAEDAQAYAICAIVRRKKPSIFLGGATKSGRSLLPRVAALLETGLTADCTALSIDNNLLMQTRPTYGGNLYATIVTRNHRPQMASVRPGIMQRAATVDNPSGIIEELKDIEVPSSQISIIEFNKYDNVPAKLSTASLIISHGRGIVSERSKQQIADIAHAMGAQAACSRPLVDEGRYPHICQVGQSGTSVQPEIYLALGISGANQHIAGIMQSKTIIAVNTDPDAPIFQYADYGFVLDANELLECLASNISNLKQ